ncbi:ABC transporter ATP-binding protein (plasmid) [Salipiger sp. CCB-MM3]|uniref:ABC transporter ATP-binding protein n=1 Tax=Salipiger sp. CCB-MM3 TaxID=1792508 RepID=UPI00080AB8FA|nr:ABC transporter ATP-binding protein [Salipiger sp. CCB-MM3]ANT63678.1 ABC transporter ATP-binding protein [Salipiger sp. CCB-MM3]
MSTIELSSLAKTYGGTEIFRDLSLAIESGEFIVFVGPSGCGKSTLLRMIAGLEETSGGTIRIDGTDVTRAEPQARGLSMVFQSYALYPHMTVRENIAFALHNEKLSKDEIAARVAEAARALRIEDYLDRRPKALSGGQRQRVAIGRAIVRKPRAFLFDEPLSNLDAALRTDTRIEIAALHKQLGATMLYVTHDQVEAMTLADRIVVLNKGKIMQVGTPEELYSNPANAFVAQFLGNPGMNLVAARATETGDLQAGGAALRFSVPPPIGTARIGLRGEALRPCDPGTGRLAGTLAFQEYLGADLCLHVDLASGERVVVRTTGMRRHQEGAAISLDFSDADCTFFDADGNALIAGNAVTA